MPARRKPSRTPGFESLEGRRLLSDGVSARLARGVLVVVGTEGPDAIRVASQPVEARGGRPRPGAAQVAVEGVRAFPAAMVRRVVVEGLGGDDAIDVDLPDLPWVSVRVSAGAGNDRVDVRAEGDARVDGGPGDNIVNGQWERPPGSDRADATDDALLSARVVALANRERAAAGLPPLAVSDALTEAARLHADAMARLGKIEHDLPGSDHPRLADRAEAVGYAYRALAENLGYNYTDEAAVMAGWMGSPGHRANLLDPELTEAGAGVALGARGEPYHALVLGRPA